MCFVFSKQPSHRDGSFEYPQHMFWLRNKKNNFQLHTLIWGPDLKLKHPLCYVFRQQEEMQHAVQNLGNTYTDDQINQLAQRHFENSQVFGA